MSDYPHSEYSPEEISNAGSLIATNSVLAGQEVPKQIRNAFLIANNWRDAHAYPMRSIHASVRHHVRANDLDAITAARLKRMQAIRRKLGRIPVPLHKLQDLGGCRIILATIAEANLLIDVLRTKLPSKIIKESDYISKPKGDGYRSHHLVFSFRRPSRTPFDGRRIEVQVRTHLQHSWATTVEAVGLYRGEELKNQKGDKDWLKFFALMAAEIAEAEKCPTIPGTPTPSKRKAEIRYLAKSLDVLAILEAVTNTFQGTDTPLAPDYKPSHYLIRYNHNTKTVHVEPYREVDKATISYDRAEEVQRSGDQNDVVVLVEVDKINNLKAAYPNYFGDVQLFQRQLRQIVLGGSAAEYTRPPKSQTSRQSRAPIGNLSWLRGTRFQGPSEKKMKKVRKKR